MVALDHILGLAGRLDDSSSYDGARERFRRFLVEHVRDWTGARSLIEQCQYSPDEQHRYALADLVVLAGQFLGFKTSFAPPSWQARARLQIVLDVKASPSAPPDLDSLTRAVDAAARTLDAPASRRTGLCVLSPLYLYRDRVEEAAAAAPGVSLGVVNLRSLVALADMVHASRVDRQDVARLFESNLSIDFMVGLLETSSVAAAAAGESEPAGATAEAEPAATTVTASAPDDAQCWLAPVVPDFGMRPEDFLEQVVAKRLTFGVADAGAGGRAVDAGDRICFYIAGTGVVGHARVASLGGSAGLRDAHRFQQILHLEALELSLTAPAAIDSETQLRLRTAQLTPSRRQTLVKISRDSFAAMTTAKDNSQLPTYSSQLRTAE